MLARSVKRSAPLIPAPDHDCAYDPSGPRCINPGLNQDHKQKQEKWSIERNDRDCFTAAKDLARRHPQQSVRSTQTVEGVRFLSADCAEFSIVQTTTHVMRPVAV